MEEQIKNIFQKSIFHIKFEKNDPREDPRNPREDPRDPREDPRNTRVSN